MVDALLGTVKKPGTILIHEGHAHIEGFEVDGTCREVAAQACLWGAQFLLAEAMAILARPGGDNSSLDIHPDTLDKLKDQLEADHG